MKHKERMALQARLKSDIAWAKKEIARLEQDAMPQVVRASLAEEKERLFMLQREQRALNGTKA